VEGLLTVVVQNIGTVSTSYQVDLLQYTRSCYDYNNRFLLITAQLELTGYQLRVLVLNPMKLEMLNFQCIPTILLDKLTFVKVNISYTYNNMFRMYTI